MNLKGWLYVATKIKKRIFGNNSGFKIKDDPNEWTERDVEYMARLLIRVSKKNKIKMIRFNGVDGINNPRSIKYTWSSTYGETREFMDFDVEFDERIKNSRKTNLEDIKMMLIMEVL